MTEPYFLNVPNHSWYMSTTRKGRVYVFGLDDADFHPDNLRYIETGHRDG